MIPTGLGPTRSMGPFQHPVVVMLVLLLLLLLLLPTIPPLPTPLQRIRPQPAHPRRLLRLRMSNWLPREERVVEPASSMPVKCVGTVALTPASVPAGLLAILPIRTIAAIPTFLQFNGSTLSSQRLGLAAANLRSMPGASASPFAIVMRIVPSSLANVAMVFTRTTADRRLPEGECFAVLSKGFPVS